MAERTSILLAEQPLTSLDDYLGAGGGEGIRAAVAQAPEAVIDEVKRSGLRGRGGAGFPTGLKWMTVRDEQAPRKFAVCNAAEGEPGTFKDRWLLRRNPYQVLEGLAVAAYAVGAEGAYLGIKSGFEEEIAALTRALKEMEERELLGSIPVQIIGGPDEYLFGEEKALLEVIEGGEPLPRVFPPYMWGLFASTEESNPAAVNNVETLANVPHILRNGADWFRSMGTERSPGTMVFTLSGDVRRPGIYELPLGLPLRELVFEIGGGPSEGRQVKAIFPGASSTILSPEQLDTPLDFDSMKAVGSGLGSAGLVVYDDSTCIVAATLAFSRFLFIESCGQCPACKHGSRDITALLEKVEEGNGSPADLDTILARCLTVTDAQRCALPTGETLLVQSALQVFGDEFTAHLGAPCPRPRHLPIPKFVDFDEDAGEFRYDERYRLKRPDWTYAPAENSEPNP